MSSSTTTNNMGCEESDEDETSICMDCGNKCDECDGEHCGNCEGEDDCKNYCVDCIKKNLVSIWDKEEHETYYMCFQHGSNYYKELSIKRNEYTEEKDFIKITTLQQENDNLACMMMTCQCDLDGECVICKEKCCTNCETDDSWCKHGVVCEDCINEKKYCPEGGEECGDEE